MHNVLIIDDDDDIRNLLCIALESEGYEVLLSANGRDALDLITRTKNVSLILLDWNMPVMNGKSFLDTKMNDESMRAIPTIVITASTEKIDRKGITEVIQKPLELQSLTDLLQKCLQSC